MEHCENPTTWAAQWIQNLTSIHVCTNQREKLEPSIGKPGKSQVTRPNMALAGLSPSVAVIGMFAASVSRAATVEGSQADACHAGEHPGPAGQREIHCPQELGCAQLSGGPRKVVATVHTPSKVSALIRVCRPANVSQHARSKARAQHQGAQRSQRERTCKRFRARSLIGYAQSSYEIR